MSIMESESNASMDIASFLDSTNLKPEARESDIQALCREAVKYKMAAVCVHPYRLLLARRLLAGSRGEIMYGNRFPLGADRIGQQNLCCR